MPFVRTPTFAQIPTRRRSASEPSLPYASLLQNLAVPKVLCKALSLTSSSPAASPSPSQSPPRRPSVSPHPSALKVPRSRTPDSQLLDLDLPTLAPDGDDKVGDLKAVEFTYIRYPEQSQGRVQRLKRTLGFVKAAPEPYYLVKPHVFEVVAPTQLESNPLACDVNVVCETDPSDGGLEDGECGVRRRRLRFDLSPEEARSREDEEQEEVEYEEEGTEPEPSWMDFM